MVFNINFPLFENITLSPDLLILLKAILAISIGIFMGVFIKFGLRKIIKLFIIEKIFKKDISAYETTTKISKITTEIIQWIIIIVFVNYSLIILNLNFTSNIANYILQKTPKIALFVSILFIGYIISKIVGSFIRKKQVKNKEEISLITEIILNVAFILSAIEYIGIEATALIELYKALIYLTGAFIILFLLKPDIFKKKEE